MDARAAIHTTFVSSAEQRRPVEVKLERFRACGAAAVPSTSIALASPSVVGVTLHSTLSRDLGASTSWRLSRQVVLFVAFVEIL